MDLTTIVGGAVIALLQGMDAAGVERVAVTLHTLATRPACSPAEQHIFRAIADSVDLAARAPSCARAVRPRFQVIEGGAA